MQIWMIMKWIFNTADATRYTATSAATATSIEKMTRLPRRFPPYFFYWLSVDTKATSRILEKQEAKNRGTTTHTPWYNLDYAATPRKQVEPRKNNNNKLSFVGVRIVQAVNKSKKQIQAKKLLARGRKAA